MRDRRPSQPCRRPALLLLGMASLFASATTADAAGCHADARPTFGLEDPWRVSARRDLPRRPARIDRLPCPGGAPIQPTPAVEIAPPGDALASPLPRDADPAECVAAPPEPRPSRGDPAPIDRPPRARIA